MTFGQYIKQASDKIRVAGLQCLDPNRHASQILEFILGWDRSKVAVRLEDELPADVQQKADAFLARRLTGEPFQYIAGEEWFWKSRFEVGPGVLIPRRETEFVVEALLGAGLPLDANACELGAGSGNIGISVLLERPTWTWHGFEKNPDTWPYLKRNIQKLLPVDHHYHLHEENFFSGAYRFSPYQLVVSNPPYVSREQMAELSKEVKCEPTIALEAGDDGLDIIRELVPLASRLLAPQGIFVTEIDFEQSDKVRELCLKHELVDVHIIEDYSHRPRVVWARKG